jgi:glycosyltransferase involved in cell wall biosynthesis
MTHLENAPSPALSVVVPVFNAGERIAPLLRSLAEQTMSPERFEVVFVDDGSTDGTGERLDAEAAATKHRIRVVHTPPSGWAGKPRNIGLAAARGTWVLFVDSDDWLGREALERLLAFGERCGADIVLGRMVGHGRGVPREVFRATVEDATLTSAPLMDSLTCHKLYRLAFLREHGLRFPDEPRRLEDHVFVVRAYLLARRISVYADYPCYHHARHSGIASLTSTEIEPASYYECVRDVLDIIDAHVPVSPLRDRLYSRYLRVEMLGRLEGAKVARYSTAHLESLFSQVKRLLCDRFPRSVDRLLSPRLQLLAAVVRAGDARDVAALAARDAAVGLDLTLVELSWAGSDLHVAVSADLVGTEHLVEPYEAVQQLDAAAGDQVVHVSVAGALDRGWADLVLRRRGDGMERRQRMSATARLGPDGRMVLDGRVDVPAADLGRAAVWDVSATVAVAGWERTAKLGPVRSAEATSGARPAVVEQPARVVVPYWTTKDSLAVDVDGTVRNLQRALRPNSAGIEGRTLQAVLPAHADVRRSVQLRLRGTDGVLTARGELVPGHAVLLTGVLPWRLPLGRFEVALALPDRREVDLGLTVERRGVHLHLFPQRPAGRRPENRNASSSASAIPTVRRYARPVKAALIRCRRRLSQRLVR